MFDSRYLDESWFAILWAHGGALDTRYSPHFRFNIFESCMVHTEYTKNDENDKMIFSPISYSKIDPRILTVVY